MTWRTVAGTELCRPWLWPERGGKKKYHEKIINTIVKNDGVVRVIRVILPVTISALL